MKPLEFLKPLVLTRPFLFAINSLEGNWYVAEGWFGSFGAMRFGTALCESDIIESDISEVVGSRADDTLAAAESSDS